MSYFKAHKFCIHKVHISGLSYFGKVQLLIGSHFPICSSEYHEFMEFAWIIHRSVREMTKIFKTLETKAKKLDWFTLLKPLSKNDYYKEYIITSVVTRQIFRLQLKIKYIKEEKIWFIKTQYFQLLVGIKKQSNHQFELHSVLINIFLFIFLVSSEANTYRKYMHIY